MPPHLTGAGLCNTCNPGRDDKFASQPEPHFILSSPHDTRDKARVKVGPETEAAGTFATR